MYFQKFKVTFLTLDSQDADSKIIEEASKAVNWQSEVGDQDEILGCSQKTNLEASSNIRGVGRIGSQNSEESQTQRGGRVRIKCGQGGLYTEDKSASIIVR